MTAAVAPMVSADRREMTHTAASASRASTASTPPPQGNPCVSPNRFGIFEGDGLKSEIEESCSRRAGHSRPSAANEIANWTSPPASPPASAPPAPGRKKNRNPEGQMELGGTQRENQAGKCSFLWRMVLRGLLVIMLLQTLVFHYFADMVVAVPFTLSLYALTAAVPWSADRLKALGFGILSVAIWLVTLRWGAPLF